jgi:alpha-glucosidase (family GH31 glycosyl hydrolase)
LKQRGSDPLAGVSVQCATFHWTPSSDRSVGQLNGTYEALDCYSTPMQCYAQYWSSAMQPGLLSTAGWAVVDDTDTARFAAGGNWTWWGPGGGDSVLADLYLFVFPDLDFRRVLQEYSTFSGNPSVPPRDALGVWWSRYYPYTADSIVSQVLDGYKNYSLPLDVLVLDMDWHQEPSNKNCHSWGNYDWNTKYFPDPVGFCNSIHSSNNVLGRPLRMSLNLHPDTGVDSCDSRYPEIARRMGLPPNGTQIIPCNFENVTFANAVFDVYLNAQPLQQIDWWWTDYGGCGGGPNQMLWSNYVFDSNPGAFSKGERPLVLSRFGGLGTHRTPIGFSGDTFQHEVSLDFLIQSTPMAANVLFGFWSHDVGGFHTGQGCPGDANPQNYTGSELFLRWVQFAALSPIFRTHCDHCERRIWEFPYHFPQLKDSFLLRASLVPYIYTHSLLFALHTKVAPVHPLYLDWPNETWAYKATHEYMFGSSILAAPISQIVGQSIPSVSVSVWLPPGRAWIDWDGNELYEGGQVVSRNYTTWQIPLFVDAGSIVPFQTSGAAKDSTPNLTWVLWTSGSSARQAEGFVLEDDGVTIAYRTGAPAATRIACNVTPSQFINCTVAKTQGSFVGQRGSRVHTLQIRGGDRAVPNKVTVNGKPLSPNSVIRCKSTSLVCPFGAIELMLGTFTLSNDITVVVEYAKAI